MKKAMIVISLLMLICGCAERQAKKTVPILRPEQGAKQMFPIWDGESPLYPSTGGPDSEQPLLIVWYEPLGIEEKWYPRKVFGDTKTVKQITNLLWKVEPEALYTFKSERYLLIVSVAYGLDSRSAMLVPFMLCDDGYVVTPSGKDKKLYEILTSAPEKENFFGSEDEANKIKRSRDYKQHCEPQRRESNWKPAPPGFGF